MKDALSQVGLDDVAAFVGLALIAVGLAMIYLPLALIVVGAILMAIWWRL